VYIDICPRNGVSVSDQVKPTKQDQTCVGLKRNFHFHVCHENISENSFSFSFSHNISFNFCSQELPSCFKHFVTVISQKNPKEIYTKKKKTINFRESFGLSFQHYILADIRIPSSRIIYLCIAPIIY
jgi:hypothetical protein